MSEPFFNNLCGGFGVGSTFFGELKAIMFLFLEFPPHCAVALTDFDPALLD
jgi:hypothetical protein